MTSKDDEIQNARLEDERRGRRPINIAEKTRRQILLKKFKEALESNDVELFKEAIIHDLGQLPGTPEYRESLKIWYARHDRS